MKMTQRENFAELFIKLDDNTREKVKQDLAKFSPSVDIKHYDSFEVSIEQSNNQCRLNHPILVSTKHPAVVLMLREIYKDNQHEGTEFVRSLVQERFWIIGLRNALSIIKSKCVRCRSVALQPIHPHMADLLKERVQGNVYPFKNTGVD